MHRPITKKVTKMIEFRCERKDKDAATSIGDQKSSRKGIKDGEA
jgi:hypothetical protein